MPRIATASEDRVLTLNEHPLVSLLLTHASVLEVTGAYYYATSHVTWSNAAAARGYVTNLYLRLANDDCQSSPRQYS